MPESLGGKNICENVCDSCNHYFGSYNDGVPPIEAVLRETFGISRARFLSGFKEIGKNKTLPFFKSIYFDIDWTKREVKLKSEFKRRHLFSEYVARQLKKGLYKVILEEIERKNKNGLDPKYDFIREFSRYNLDDYPLFYFRRKFDLIPIDITEVRNPRIDWFEDGTLGHGYLIFNHSFLEFELLGHVFGIPLSKLWHLTYNMYIEESNNLKKDWFYNGFEVKALFDIDLALRVLNT